MSVFGSAGSFIIILSNPAAVCVEISFDSFSCVYRFWNYPHTLLVIDERWKLLTDESLQNLELLLSSTQIDEKQETLFSLPPFLVFTGIQPCISIPKHYLHLNTLNSGSDFNAPIIY